ncbi:SLBB domain-containing protein [Pontiellaceae bacterium B12227]|nr:SLBB domain-containing protein [Pontiellaceae bacterium B12227]
MIKPLIQSFVPLAVLLLFSSCSSSKNTLMQSDQDYPQWLEDVNLSTLQTNDMNGAVSPVLPPRTATEDYRYDQLPGDRSGIKNLQQRLSGEPSYFFRQPTPAASSNPNPSAPSPAPSNPQQVSVVVNNMGPSNQEATARQRPDEPLSRIEQLYNRSSGAAGGSQLRQFGYNQLCTLASDRLESSHTPSTGSNTMNPGSFLNEESQNSNLLLDPGGPIDADFLVGPGDEIILRITGAVEMNESRIVQRDGTVFIPEVGAVVVSGIRAGELNETIRQAVEEQYNPVKVEATPGRLHAIRIMLFGHARQPGQYFLPANASLIDALIAANGPSKDGSLRQIVLRRPGQPDQKIDLYDILIGGKTTKNLRLLSGDTIHIPTIGTTAAVVGPMLEGIYEVSTGETLADLARFAGGLTPFARKEQIQLERTTNGLERNIINLDFTSDAQKFLLADGDLAIFAEAYDRINEHISLEGRVISPGRYPFHAGMLLSELLRLGDGFLIDASLDRALLIRQLGDRRTFDIKPDDAKGEVRSELIWIDLPSLFAGEARSDIELRRLDRLIIFSENSVREDPRVSVMGAVRQPGTYALTSGMRVKDLLLLASNTMPEAYNGYSMIVRRSRASDGRHLDVELIPFNLDQALKGDASANLVLQNHDQVVIRRVQTLQVRVNIEGRVQFPGTYVLPDGSTIADLMKTAGGLLPGADLRASTFNRVSVQQEEMRQLADMQRRNQEYFTRVRNRVTRDGYYNESMANQMALSSLNQQGANERQFQATGRIVLNLTQADFPETTDNLTLEDGDRLSIPRLKNTISVLGRVFNPNAFICRQESGLRVKDYLEMAGGLQDDADKKQFYVLLASGEVHSAAQSGRRKLLSMVPSPGDAILVPQEPLERSTKSMISDSLMVMQQMAELGMMGAAIPNISGPAVPDISIQSGSRQISPITTFDASYQPMIDSTTGGQP